MKRLSLTAGLSILALSLSACGPYQLDQQESLTAQIGAREAADRSQADYVDCSGQDSDKDGYVTCTIRGRAAPHVETELLCAYKTKGCKRKT